MNNKSNPYSYGIILILLTYLSFGILDTIQKTAVQYHSVFVLLFVKYTFCLIFSFFIAKKNNVKKYYLSNNYKIQITRCVLSVCEACFFVLSFRYLALAGVILNALICKNKPIQKKKPKNIKNIKENE